MLGEEYFFTLIVLFPIHTDVFEVHSLLVVFNAVFSEFKSNGQREVTTAVRDKYINKEGHRDVRVRFVCS